MNREQARAIMENIDLIRHFAEGGEIGHRRIDYKGHHLGTYITNTIILSNMAPGKHCLYVRVKHRLRWDEALGAWIHAPRRPPRKILEHEIMTRPVHGATADSERSQ